jgi:hypothetical protein
MLLVDPVLDGQKPGRHPPQGNDQNELAASLAGQGLNGHVIAGEVAAWQSIHTARCEQRHTSRR